MVNILTINAFDDNYIWLIKDQKSDHCIIVDPGDAAPVLEMLEQQKLTLDAILITHHHHDHTGGVQALQSALACHQKNKIPVYDNKLENETRLHFFNDHFSLNVMAVPGHTLDHIAFITINIFFVVTLYFRADAGVFLKALSSKCLIVYRN